MLHSSAIKTAAFCVLLLAVGLGIFIWWGTYLKSRKKVLPVPVSNICSLNPSDIPFGRTIKLRALILSVASGHGLELTGRSCVEREVVFKVEGSPPENVVQEIWASIAATERQRKPVGVEAELVVELGIPDVVIAGSYPLTGTAKIKSAAHLKLVPFNFPAPVRHRALAQ